MSEARGPVSDIIRAALQDAVSTPLQLHAYCVVEYHLQRRVGWSVNGIMRRDQAVVPSVHDEVMWRVRDALKGRS